MSKKSLLIAIALLICTALWLLYDRFIEDGNFTIVGENEIYRSATLSHHEWKEIRREHPPFKSVINLRGERDRQMDWYKREIDLSHKSGINFFNFPLSAGQPPSLTDMEALIELMRSAPKPLLIHCKQGADRTGLALALYNYAIKGEPAEHAAKQLSLFWGHFPWLTSRTGAMDKAFSAYVTAHPQQKQN
jgi:protein tyrosine/serine phosphatase